MRTSRSASCTCTTSCGLAWPRTRRRPFTVISGATPAGPASGRPDDRPRVEPGMTAGKAHLPRTSGSRRAAMPSRLDPALKLAQHQLADDVHAGVAVVEAGDRGKLLAALVLEDLGVFLGDLFQRFQAIGGKAGHHDGDAAHAILRQLLDGLVGVGLQPLVEAEARLECESQLRGIQAHAL